MFVLKDFVPDCFVAQICSNSGARAHDILAHICATKQSRTKSFRAFSTNIETIPKNMPTNVLAQTVKSEARYRRKT